MSGSPSSPFASIPQEVLEHIAYFAAADSTLGPPGGIVPLLLLNRSTYNALTFHSNSVLYARIFAHKFDVGAAVRRLGAERIHTGALAEELKRRCIHLKRIRRRLDCKLPETISRHEHEEQLSAVLWTSYFMMLENEGKNEAQLREYGMIDVWLKEFWFHPSGASQAIWSVNGEEWPVNNERMSLAMWLFWLLLRPDDYMGDETAFRAATSILKLIALGAHQYPLCYPPWYDFIPTRPWKESSRIRIYSSDLTVVAPAPAAPAILSYLTLANKLTVSWEAMNYMRPLAPTVYSTTCTKQSKEWDGEWARTLNVGDPKVISSNTLSRAFKPGSLHGVWEGLFTYTDFTAYAALLSGAPPQTLHRSLVAQHRQTWKLREYHLVEFDTEVDNNIDTAPHSVRPLGPGNPSRGYIPNGTELDETVDTLEIFEQGSREAIIYRSCDSIKKDIQKMGSDKWKGKVKDVIVTGEVRCPRFPPPTHLYSRRSVNYTQGHSAWGQFNLIGRVRPSDGFISLSKEYVDGDRGRWLYRGYMVGDANGNLSGRWRDTLTLPHVAGYEGCFVMSRRK
ncbi:hypothetical protein K474DRAFT_1597216 [Panus rudis PR-1116 ss-1]|nr:hypothetical protein K474DRAFT_1597216 [Panus rudis PR-1116 ss-1]